MPRIIQFSHPGEQIVISKRSKRNGLAYRFNNDNSGVRFWNNENRHFRKFLVNNGLYLTDLEAAPKEGRLHFWGEWEPQSNFTLTGLTGKYVPNAIHEPFFTSMGQGIHNTDPFVFGKYFYYSNCKQGRNKMNSLSSGDIIIFGSEFSDGFALDTVFVVKDSISTYEYRKDPTRVPDLLRRITLDINNLYINNNEFRLYKGEMYQDSTKSIFSFFPCKLANQGTYPRPMLSFDKFGLQSPGAGTVLRDIKYTSSEFFWFDLIEEIRKQGYYLGIQTDMPVTRNVDLPELKLGQPC
jgi:hypothetical protein